MHFINRLLTYLLTRPSPPQAITRWHHLQLSTHLLTSEGWKAELPSWLTSSVGFTHTGGHPSRRQLQVKRRTGKVRRLDWRVTTVPCNQVWPWIDAVSTCQLALARCGRPGQDKIDTGVCTTKRHSTLQAAVSQFQTSPVISNYA